MTLEEMAKLIYALQLKIEDLTEENDSLKDKIFYLESDVRCINSEISDLNGQVYDLYRSIPNDP
jgi:peptidoglycan hydrolase CwlO-like protein